MRTREEVKRAFQPIEGKPSLVQSQAIMKITAAYQDLADQVMVDVPECADRTAAVRKLLESKFTAIQAITHTGYEPKGKQDGKEK